MVLSIHSFKIKEKTIFWKCFISRETEVFKIIHIFLLPNFRITSAKKESFVKYIQGNWKQSISVSRINRWLLRQPKRIYYIMILYIKVLLNNRQQEHLFSSIHSESFWRKEYNNYKQYAILFTGKGQRVK